jgi:predicted porin
VQIYGRLYPYLLQEQGSGATAAGTAVSTIGATPTGVDNVRRTRGMQAGNSRLGFRGSENLGGGLKAFFQLEGVASVDWGNASLFTRDSFVGAAGWVGTVRLGHMDTVFKNYGDTLGFLGIAAARSCRPGGCSVAPDSAPAGYLELSPSPLELGHLRNAEDRQHACGDPVLDQRGQYRHTGSTPGVDGHQVRPRSLLRFPSPRDPLRLLRRLAECSDCTAQHRDQAVNSRDHATQLAIEYRLTRNHRFEFDVIQKTYKENPTIAGRFQTYKNVAYQVVTDHRFGDRWRAAFQYVHADDGRCTLVNTACSTQGLKGDKFGVGLQYSLSRRTHLFGAYNILRNGKSARYTNVEFGNQPSPGEDIQQFAFGINHGF